MSYQNQIGQEKFDSQDPSQGINYDISDLSTKAIVPDVVDEPEAEHSAQVTIITVDSAINKLVIIIDREYVFTKIQRNNNVRKAEIGPEWQVLRKKNNNR